MELEVGNKVKQNITIEPTNELWLQVNALRESIQRVRDLHHPTTDGRHCMACSLLVASVTKGLGTAQYPCTTILFLDGEQ